MIHFINQWIIIERGMQVMASLLQRVNAGLRAFRGVQKDAPYVWPVFQGGQTFWRMDNFKSYAREGYELNSIIHSAVNYKGRTIAQGKLVAYQGDIDNPLKLESKHPLQQLLQRPNPYQSWMEFQWQRETYLNLSGNSYTWLDRPKTDALPTALWNLRPDRVYIVPNERRLMGYLYVPDDRARADGIPMLPEDMIHVKFPNPMDRFEGLGYGLAPLAPMAQSGDVDNAITRYLKIFFERGSMPPGVLKTKLGLTDENIAEARARGEAADKLAGIYAKIINTALKEKPADMVITTHVCRGNFRSTWISEGGYEPVAELLLGGIDYDGYFLEYDSERAGGLEPLRFLPKGKKRVVVGLVTSKSGTLEKKDDIKRRLGEAAKYAPLEQLCLSPQCGFASTEEGNVLTEDQQWAKLKMIVDISREVWK
jgi:phage portal protein BeeE